MNATLESAFAFAQVQVKALIADYPADYYPMYTVHGKFGQDTKRWTHWCDGFYPGMMFLFAEATGESFWLDEAVKRSTPLEERQYDRAVHDLGFLFFSTHLRWLELGGPEAHVNNLLDQAGKTMAMRFMRNGQYLRSFVEPASLFIDIMMNVGTIFRAGLRLSDEHLLAVAHRHCETTRRTIVRGDGSTSHEALFNLTTGECLRQSTHQGYRGDSCWARGLAWSLYGFTRSYQQTGRTIYLQTAMANADYLLAQLPGGGVTAWDFDAPNQDIDTSGSAIAASGLLDLAVVCPDPIKSTAYRNWAIRSLELCCEQYLGDKTPGFEGILNGSIYHIHKNIGVHEACLFSEYFFVEALAKALKPSSPALLPITGGGSVVTPYPEDSLPAAFKTWVDGPTEEDVASPVDGATK
nr:glycoside hydrolase family 88 protein [Armatimonas sp.]